ncbi:MAG: beta-lactamase family protein [Candidatus Tectomicrobia bacterium]|uniref:Beta-lactamase family protein n=1 Tax=Tectimicrobiota bacterium TaxID=2528274 RepID=A0A937W333_UNCTE|nr:beta-lactamase family protein [Candidatus Tectomicrobia bacterium]
MVKPEEVGLSTPRLARIQPYFQRYIDAGKLAGTLTLVARHGQVAYCEPQGHLELERQRPMQRDSIFRIYSMSKPITSVALMMLYEQGLCQLDDPVHTYIPSWANQRVFVSGNYPVFATAPVARSMTIRDLLSHTSGLTYGFMERTNVDAAYRKLAIGDRSKPGYTLQDMVHALAELPLEFSPGTRWNYSVSTDVLGYLIEVISGQRFDVYLREQVLQPLGMHDTGFTVSEAQLPHFACNYERQRDGSLRLVDSPAQSQYRQCSLFSGGGGLVSTIADYFRFTSMLRNGGELDGIRLLGRKSIELMTMNHLPGGQDLTQLAQAGAFTETAYAGVGFGLGFSVMLDPARAHILGTPGEYAWGGAASTAFWVDPREDLVVIFMTQLMPSSSYPLRRALRTLVYAALVDA